jgi:Leucine-rich repeat (LRR) protein
LKPRQIVVIVTCIIALICGLAWVSVNLVDQSERQVNEIRAINVNAQLGSHKEEKESESDRHAMLYLRTHPGAGAVSFKGYDLTDRAMPSFAGMSKLAFLCLAYTQVGDAGLKYLENLPLRVLDLSDTRVTDDGMDAVNKIHSLDCLFVNETDVGDAGVARLKDLSNLGEIHLNDSRVTDMCAGMIAEHKNIWKVSLAATHTTDKALVDLSTLPQLTTLDLTNTDVTIKGLRLLKNKPLMKTLLMVASRLTDDDLEQITQILPTLQRLDIGRTGITDAGLKHLTKLKLKTLDLQMCKKITTEGIDAFKKACPECKVIF